MELPREPLSLELLRLDDAPHGIAGHALRQVHCDRGPGGEGLGEPKVVVVETRVRAEVVVRDDDPDRFPLRDERHVQARVDAEAACGRLVDLGVLEDGVDPLAAAAVDDASHLRVVEVELHAREPVGALAVGGSNDQPVARPRQGDQDDAGLDQLPQPAGDEVEQRRQLELRGECDPDLVQRLEPVQPASGRLVEPRVLDRDGRLRGEQLRQLEVLLGERPAAVLLGQIQVPVRDAALEDRDAQERLHRRMVGREANRAWIVGDVVEQERFGLADQYTGIRGRSAGRRWRRAPPRRSRS